MLPEPVHKHAAGIAMTTHRRVSSPFSRKSCRNSSDHNLPRWPEAQRSEVTAVCPVSFIRSDEERKNSGRRDEGPALTGRLCEREAEIPARTMRFLVPMGSLMTGCSCVGRGCRAALKEKWRLIDVGDEESAHLKTVLPFSSPHYPGRHLSVIRPPSPLQLHFLPHCFVSPLGPERSPSLSAHLFLEKHR